MTDDRARRAGDAEDYDARPHRQPAVGHPHLPVWAQAVSLVGVPSLIALGLLGFIPGVTSPIDRLETANTHAVEAMRAELRRGRITQGHTFQVLYAICVRLPAPPGAPPCDLRTAPRPPWEREG